MTLIRLLMTNFKTSVKLTVLFLDGSPRSASKSSCPLDVSARWWVSAFGQESTCPLPLSASPTSVAGIQNKANFPFHQLCLFTLYWL